MMSCCASQRDCVPAGAHKSDALQAASRVAKLRAKIIMAMKS